MTARQLTGKHALVTGAGSGIGRAVATRLAAAGAIVHLTDVDSAALGEVATELRAAARTVGVVRALDISDHDAVDALAAQAHAQVPAVDMVLNVAGVSTWGTVQALPHEEWRRMVEVNLMGPIHVIEAFVPPMIAAGRGGHLVNVSSAAGLIGLPWHAAYSASKFGVRGVSEVLRFDLARHGIAVSLVCPGGVDTPLTETVRVAGVDADSATFRAAQARFRRRAVSADVAAQKIIAGMLARRYLVYTSADIRMIHAVQRHAPWLYAVAMRAANRAADRVADRARAERIGATS